MADVLMRHPYRLLLCIALMLATMGGPPRVEAQESTTVERRVSGSVNIGGGAGLTLNSDSSPQLSGSPWAGIGVNFRRGRFETLLGVDSFIGYHFLPEGNPASSFMIAMATSSILYGQRAVRAGAYGTIGLSSAGVGGRLVWVKEKHEVDLPYHKGKRKVRHGLEARAGYYTGKHFHVAASYRIAWYRE